MTNVNIISGFLGAGKTTFIKKLVEEVFKGEKIILIENEFGEIGIDGDFLKDSGIEVTEMNSGCICCSLVGDFSKSLEEVIDKFSPDRIIIEPSGVGKLSDVEKAIIDVEKKTDIKLDSKITVVDGKKAKMYMKNFGEFFNNQIENANVIVLSRTQMMGEEKIKECLDILKEHNSSANIVTTPWDELSKEVILNAVTNFDQEKKLLEEVINEYESHEHHHHHKHEHGEKCKCSGHVHHHEHHEHGNCSCGCGHEHHDADEIFKSFGLETIHKFNKEELDSILEDLSDGSKYGVILRAKGVVLGTDNIWYEFDLVPGEYEVRKREADYVGKVCVIGTDLMNEKLEEVFK